MGSPIPEGPVGWRGVGTRPWWAGAPPLGFPLRLGLETLGWGAPHLPWGVLHPLAAAPPWEI